MAKRTENYPHIIATMKNSPWLIMPESLTTILDIVNRRLDGERLTQDEIRVRLEGSPGMERNGSRAEVGGGIGLLPMYGPIFPKANMMTEMSGATSLESFRNDFRSLMSNDLVKAVVLDIDSPGGLSDLVMETGDEIYASRDIKPTYAVADTLAGSAAYWLGAQCTEFYVTPSGSVGSIGAFTVHEDISRQEEDAGRKTSIISSGKYKAEGNKYEPLSEETLTYVQSVLDELHGQFVSAVSRGRNVSESVVRTNYGQGRMLNANDALNVGMVDGVMSLDDVIGSLVLSQKQPAVGFAREGMAARSFLSPIVKKYAEVADKEHSEPGSGIGGEPIPRETPVEKDVEQGWRRDTPPDPDVTDNHIEEGSILNREQLIQMANSLGVTDIGDDVSDDDLVARIQARQNELLAEVQPIREAVASAETTRSFRETFPDEFERMQRLEAESRANSARAFSEQFARFAKADPNNPEATIASDHGFSALVLGKIEDMHQKLTSHTAVSADLSDLLGAIANDGIVEYGERGSSRSVEQMPIAESGNQREAFAARVKEIMESDNLDRDAAIKMAAERFPEEFAAYRRPILNQN